MVLQQAEAQRRRAARAVVVIDLRVRLDRQRLAARADRRVDRVVDLVAIVDRARRVIATIVIVATAVIDRLAPR